MDNNSASNVDDLTSKLNQMNVETIFRQQQQQQQQQQHEEQMSNYYNARLENRDSPLEVHFDDTRGYSFGRPTSTDHHYNTNSTNTSQNSQQHHLHHQHGQQFGQQMSVDEENIQPVVDDNTTRAGSCQNTDRDGCTLIVTKLDPTVFSEKLMQSKFESLFLAYDEQVTFRYLKSFRRVRLDFTSPRRAELARINLSNYKLGTTAFKCYLAQIIRPNFGNSNPYSQDTNSDNYHNQQQQQQSDNDANGDDYDNRTASGYLNIPKLTRQHLISPPMSPPVGWEPKEESSPCIDVQLLSAIANLVPGQTHEIHAGSDSQPGIFVEVCEDAHFDTISKLSCRSKQLPKTMIPGTPRPQLGPALAPLGGQGQDDCCEMQS